MSSQAVACALQLTNDPNRLAVALRKTDTRRGSVSRAVGDRFYGRHVGGRAAALLCSRSRRRKDARSRVAPTRVDERQPHVMNVALPNVLVVFVPALILASGSVVLYARIASTAALNQILHAECLMVVLLARLCEERVTSEAAWRPKPHIKPAPIQHERDDQWQSQC
jgi:hypothetical protein